MQELCLSYSFQQQMVRTVSTPAEVWFALSDVCAVLGIKNSRDVWNRLDEDERDGVDFIDTIGRTQTMQAVNESGLYDTILRSNSEQAKPFRRWVTHDVLPVIRKQGYYSLLSDKDLVDVIIEKQRRDGDFLKKINKQEIKKLLLLESRQSKDLDTQLLYLVKDQYDCPTYRAKLKEIWQDDMPGFHKALDEYMTWYQKVGCRK